jgi:hypothetical protein
MVTESHSNHDRSLFNKYIQSDDYAAAFELLKRNPMLHLTLTDGQTMLNHLDDIADRYLFSPSFDPNYS